MNSDHQHDSLKSRVECRPIPATHEMHNTVCMRARRAGSSPRTLCVFAPMSSDRAATRDTVNNKTRSRRWSWPRRITSGSPDQLASMQRLKAVCWAAYLTLRSDRKDKLGLQSPKGNITSDNHIRKERDMGRDYHKNKKDPTRLADGLWRRRPIRAIMRQPHKLAGCLRLWGLSTSIAPLRERRSSGKTRMTPVTGTSPAAVCELALVTHVPGELVVSGR